MWVDTTTTAIIIATALIFAPVALGVTSALYFVMAHVMEGLKEVSGSGFSFGSGTVVPYLETPIQFSPKTPNEKCSPPRVYISPPKPGGTGLDNYGGVAGNEIYIQKRNDHLGNNR